MVKNLNSYDHELTIYVYPPWMPDSPAAVALAPPNGDWPKVATDNSLSSFLEIAAARDFLAGWDKSLKKPAPLIDRVKRLIEYAINDAPPPTCESRPIQARGTRRRGPKPNRTPMGKVTTLTDVIQNLDTHDQELTIYVHPPWRPDSPAAVAMEPPDGDLPEAATDNSLSYFLEIDIARDFLAGWDKSLKKPAPLIDRVKRLIEYAINDA
ncbi:MAG: hypothetical protein NTW19_22720 [Planctomycetota bacterium]|nr:hypothetical protein [Planctomycetota bacterium]